MPYLTFDPRSKLAVVFCASLLLMVRANQKIEGIFVLSLFVLLLLNGAWKKGILLTTLYFFFFVMDVYFFSHLTDSLMIFLSFFFVANRLLLPPVMAAVFASNRTTMSEWIAAMKKMKVPQTIIVPFSVVCRFFPVLIQDFKQIRRAMKFRGIGINSTDLIWHPLLTLEYIIVPILVSVETSSLDLSAAALVRGLGSAEKNTSIYRVRFNIQDYVLLLFLLIFIILGVVLQ